MLSYAVCEIGGKQYKVLPNIPFNVDYRGKEGLDIEANVMLLAKDGKLHLGKPYLKEKLTLKFVENKKGAKIRVSKYHAKANYRRTTGIRPKFTTLILSVKN
ncbi:50S ribosomal protein L21 [Candidatus Daviesbacteria bacterium]|nr:50S ribosomal protein L21 [Candidatus Daviesbacteria bacterium]